MKLPDIGESSLGGPQPTLSVAQYRPESAADMEAPGQAMVGLGNAVQQQVDRIGTLQAEDRYTQLRNWQLDAMHGQNGLLNLKGSASVNGPSIDDATAQFNDAAKRFGDGLSGVGAQLYQQRAQISGLQFKEQVLRHQTEQSVQWSNSVTDSGVQSEIDQIGANYKNDNLIGASLARINGLIDAHAADPSVGWTRGQTDIAKKIAIEKAETARWQAWSLDDPVGAYANFKANQGVIVDPALRVKIDHELKSLSYPVQGDAIATKAIADASTHKTLTGAGAPEGDWSLDMPGFKGDPTVIANQLSRLLADPSLTSAKRADLEAAQAQLKKQLQTPGGVATVPDFGKTDVMAQYSKMLDSVHSSAGGDVMLEQHALQSLHGHLTGIVKAQDAVFKQNYDTVLKEITFDGNPGPTSVTQLSAPAQQSYVQMTPEQQRAIAEAMRESSNIQRGQYKQSNPQAFNSLLQRIYLDPGDPNQIRTRADLVPYQSSGQINFADFQHLAGEIDKAQTPEGSVFGKQVNRVKSEASAMLRNALTGTALQHPELADEAAYRFGLDFDNRLKATRAAGDDLQTLFTPGSKNYALDPNRVMAFMPNEQQVAAYVTKLKAPQTAPMPTGAPRQPGESPADYLKRIGK